MKIFSFGITKEITKATEIDFFPEEGPVTVRELKRQLTLQYPELARLTTMAIAVNQTFATDDTLVEDLDEVALIPPVSGG